MENSGPVQGLIYLQLIFKISNFIHRLSNESEIAMCSAQSTQFRHIYIAAAAQSYKFHFTVTVP